MMQCVPIAIGTNAVAQRFLSWSQKKLYRPVELFEEALVVFAEKAQVFDLVF